MDTTPNQTLTYYESLLGQHRNSPPVEEFLNLHGGWHHELFYDKPTKVNWEIAENQTANLRVQFREGITTTISLFVVKDNTDFIPGMNLLIASSEELVERFGTPVSTGRNSIQYVRGEHKLTFAFLNGSLRAVTVSLPRTR